MFSRCGLHRVTRENKENLWERKGRTRDTKGAPRETARNLLARACFFSSRCLISREVAGADGHGDNVIRDSSGNRSRPARKLPLLFRHGNLTRPVTRFFSGRRGCNKSDVRVLLPMLPPATLKCRTAGRFNRNLYARPADIDSRNSKTNRRNLAVFSPREISVRALFDGTSSVTRRSRYDNFQSDNSSSGRNNRTRAVNAPFPGFDRVENYYEHRANLATYILAV